MYLAKLYVPIHVAQGASFYKVRSRNHHGFSSTCMDTSASLSKVRGRSKVSHQAFWAYITQQAVSPIRGIGEVVAAAALRKASRVRG